MLLYTLISVFSQLIDIVVMVVIVQFVLSLLIAFNVVNLHNKAVAAVWTALARIIHPVEFGALSFKHLASSEHT